MRPTLDTVLETILLTFEQQIVPNLDDSLAQSYARTISALLSQVRARVGHEGETLFEEARDVRVLLASLVDRLDDPLRREVVETLSRRWLKPGDYPDLRSLDLETEELRRVLVKVIKKLPPDQRGEIRAHLATQLEREKECIPISPSPF